MAYTLSNKCAKNCCKRTILVQIIIEDVAACFFGTKRHFCSNRNFNRRRVIFHSINRVTLHIRR